ncbi:MAG: hypothetical protein ACK5JD_15645 [Mangrovibacterium sp.]
MKQIVAAVLLVFLLGCEKDELEFDYWLPTPEGLAHWEILKVEGERSVNLGETLILTVFCPRASGCDIISQVLSDEHDNRIFIKVFGRTITDLPCSTAAVPQIIDYEFTPNKKGIYRLEFIKKDGARIIVPVQVK